MNFKPLPIPQHSVSPSRRKVHRSRAVLLMARLETEWADDLCLISDISPAGAGLRTARAMVVGEAVKLEFGDTLVVGGTVRWLKDGCCGVEFDRVIDLEPLFRRAGMTEQVRRALQDRGEPMGRRAQPRLRRCAEVLVRHERNDLPGQLVDLSPDGARIDLAEPAAIAPGDRVNFTIEDRLDCEGTVRWVRGRSAGVAFETPLRLWKLEKWLVAGLDRCGECRVAQCSAPSFKRALARRDAVKAGQP